MVTGLELFPILEKLFGLQLRRVRGLTMRCFMDEAVVITVEELVDKLNPAVAETRLFGLETLISCDVRLLPCPFCGSPASISLVAPAHEHVIIQLPPVGDTWLVECSGCAAGFVGGAQAEVVLLWNRRPDALGETK